MYFIEKYFSAKFDLWGPQAKIEEKRAEVPHRSNFAEIFFSIKSMLIYSVFYADSESNVYFAWKLMFDSQNLEIRANFGVSLKTLKELHIQQLLYGLLITLLDPDFHED